MPTDPAPAQASAAELIALLLRLSGHAQRLSGHPGSGTAHTDALAALEAARTLAAAQPAPAPADAGLRAGVEGFRAYWEGQRNAISAEERGSDFRLGQLDGIGMMLADLHDRTALLAHPTPPAGAGAEAWKEVAVTRLRPGDRVRSGRTVVTVARVGEGAYPDEWNVGWAENIPNTRYRRDARVFAAQAQAEGGSQ